MPAIIYCDRHKSNIHVMENSELLLQTNDILMKTKKIKCHFAPVSDHHSHGMFKQLISNNSMINFLGLVESKIRYLGKSVAQTQSLEIRYLWNFIFAT